MKRLDEKKEKEGSKMQDVAFSNLFLPLHLKTDFSYWW